MPCAKIIGNETFSIINDYIGRPILAFNEKGEKVWETDYDIYGDLKNLKGDREFIHKMKTTDKSKRYEHSKDFFELNGNCVMKISPLAAIDVCRECITKNRYVWRIEGGIWHNPGFEARIDCIWDSSYSPDNTTNIGVEKNNKLAEAFILEEMDIHDTFIITIYQKPTSG